MFASHLLPNRYFVCKQTFARYPLSTIICESILKSHQPFFIVVFIIYSNKNHFSVRKKEKRQDCMHHLLGLKRKIPITFHL